MTTTGALFQRGPHANVQMAGYAGGMASLSRNNTHAPSEVVSQHLDVAVGALMFLSSKQKGPD